MHAPTQSGLSGIVLNYFVKEEAGPVSNKNRGYL